MVQEKRNPTKIRLRLLISIPTIITVFTIGTGFLTINLMKDIPPQTLTSRYSLLMGMVILLIATLAGITGIMVARGITKPMKTLTTRAEELIMETGEEFSVHTATNEVDALTGVFNNAFVSINKLVLDKHILDNLPEGVITLNDEREVVDLNKMAANFLHCYPQQLKGVHIEEIFPSSEGNAYLLDLINKGWKDKEVHFHEATPSFMGKKTKPVMVRMSMVRKKGLKELMIIIKDPEEVKTVRKQIQKVEQLAILGAMASGVAHEVRNPLGAMRGLTELISKDLSSDDPKKLYTKKVIKEIDRLNRLVENILCFAKTGLSRLEPTDINQVLSQTVSIVSHSFHQKQKDVSVIKKQQPDLPLLYADTEKLLQAFLNILDNAFEAAPDGGRVEIRSYKSKAEAVIITISDNGPGINNKNSPHIFDPFYTTKEKGTGLGLSITQNIITAHNGSIEVESTQGHGTTFKVMLPVDGLPVMTTILKNDVIK